MSTSISKEIYELEERLLSAETRKSPDELSNLLSDGFIEFGSSGDVYTKEEVIRSLQQEPDSEFKVSEFRARALSPEVVLATYRVEKLRAGDDGAVHSLRSSIWKLSDVGWRLVFHQGTKVE